MTDTSTSENSQPLRVEFTILDGKLHREEVQYFPEPTPHPLLSTPYASAVSAPFPDKGKSGLSIFVGRMEQYMKNEVPLLWALEKKRGRQRMAVVTNLRGKGFAPAIRKLHSCLGDSHVAPISFLRRRGEKWDSLDFFSSGHSPSMEGAAPRLKRLKQRGWELVVDRLALTDPEIKELYFETLHVERTRLQQAFLEEMSAGRLAAMVGIAGQCLQKKHLGFFLKESMNSRILEAAARAQKPQELEGWTFLGKRRSGKELVLLSKGEAWLKEGEVLSGQMGENSGKSELLVSKLLQRLQFAVGESCHTVVRVQVEWRYRPDREIPIYWTQNSTSPAGSEVLHG